MVRFRQDSAGNPGRNGQGGGREQGGVSEADSADGVFAARADDDAGGFAGYYQGAFIYYHILMFVLGF